MGILDKLRKKDKRGRRGQDVTVRGSGGQLKTQSVEGIQQLTRDRGLLRPPLSATTAGEIGATQDQQKMIGTPAQKAAALDMGMGRSELARQQKVEPTRQVATEAEADKIEMSENLRNLEGLGQRVHEAIQTSYSEMTATTDLSMDNLDKIIPGAQSVFDEAVAATGSQLDGVLALAKLLKAEGMADLINEDNTIKWDSLTLKLPEQAQMLKDIVAEADPDSLPASDVVTGDAEMMELLTELGIDPTDMTVSQFQEQLDAVIDAEYQQIEDVEAMSTNPALSESERREAREILREMGAVGVASAAQAAEDIQGEIEAADEITVAGETYTLDEFLENDVFSGMAADFVRDMQDGYIDKDGNIIDEEKLRLGSQQLLDFAPDMVSSFIVPQYDALSATVDAFGDEIGSFNTIQEDNNKVALALGDKAMEVLGMTPGEMVATKYRDKVEGNAMGEALLNPDENPGVSEGIKRIIDSDPDIISEVAELDSGQLSKLLVDGQGQQYKLYSLNKTQREALDSAVTADDVRSVVFGPNMTRPQFDALIEEAYDAAVLGFGSIGLAEELRGLYDNPEGLKTWAGKHLNSRIVEEVIRADLDPTPIEVDTSLPSLSEVADGAKPNVLDVINQLSVDTSAKGYDAANWAAYVDAFQGGKVKQDYLDNLTWADMDTLVYMRDNFGKFGNRSKFNNKIGDLKDEKRGVGKTIDHYKIKIKDNNHRIKNIYREIGEIKKRQTKYEVGSPQERSIMKLWTELLRKKEKLEKDNKVRRSDVSSMKDNYLNKYGEEYTG